MLVDNIRLSGLAEIPKEFRRLLSRSDINLRLLRLPWSEILNDREIDGIRRGVGALAGYIVTREEDKFREYCISGIHVQTAISCPDPLGEFLQFMMTNETCLEQIFPFLSIERWSESWGFDLSCEDNRNDMVESMCSRYRRALFLVQT